MKLLSIVLCFLFYLNVGQGARILGIFHMPSPSHYILGSTLMKQLAERGHDITIVSPFTDKNKPKNGTWTEIELTGFTERMAETMSKFNFFENTGRPASSLISIIFLKRMGLEKTDEFFKHPNVQKLLTSNKKFDVVIMEQFMNDAFKYIPTHFNAPLIVFSAIGPSHWTNSLVGNPDPPSFIGDSRLGLPNHMTLLERVQNTLVYVYLKLVRYLWFLPAQKSLLNKYFPDAKADFYDSMYNTSLVLLNSHVSTMEPTPLMPNMIEIGGFHIQPPKALPKDLQQFLDSATDGAIYFSMGSNLKSKDLPVKTRNAILNVFAKLKQKVLWKFEDKDLPGKPDNVEIISWAPQQDVLAHSNVKVFITHGGFGGMQETIHQGVPILAIPIFGDQHLNAQRAVQAGIGLKIQLNSLTEENFEETLKELLENPKYKENVERKSRIMQDRPRSAKDTATFWVEYVIRHQGAPHLRTAAMDLTWYQYIMLDVLAIIGGTIAVTLLSLYYLVRLCCCRRKSSIKDRTKVKKN